MAFTVQDLLDLPVMAAARPETVVGTDLAHRPVRWIHSSEIYEIWSLLKGGEALLTTGLGLVGRSPAAVDAYCRHLADRDVAVLMLELGRTFPVPPRPLVEAAAANRLPLVALHGVVPFVDITETVHPLLLENETTWLRRAEQTSAALTRSLLAGEGLNGLVATVAAVCDAPVGVYLLDGSLLAGADVGPLDGFEVEVGPGPWATLRVVGEETSERRRLAGLCADAVAVHLAHEYRPIPSRPSAASALLRDLAARRPLSPTEVESRCTALGLRSTAGGATVTVVVTSRLRGPATVVRPVTLAAQETLGSCAVAEIDDAVVVVTVVPRARVRRALESFVVTLEGLTASGAGVHLRVVAAQAGEQLHDLARTVPAAMDATALVSRLGLSTRLVLASDLAVYDALASMGDAELERFVTDQLGPLLDHDARTRSTLVATLDTYLECGLSKTAAAAALGVRRQTLYARLEKMSELLGGLDLGERPRRTALDLALAAWRMRSAPSVPAPTQS
jgi:PucR family transcriptional regulator, purine catabolism regulatory protein